MKGDTHCKRGHDLRLTGAIYERPDGKQECRRCKRDGRERNEREKAPKSPRPPRRRTKPEPSMKPPEIEAYFARMREEENAPPWEKRKRMWPNDPPQRQR